MTEIIPAILPKDFSNLEHDLSRIVGISPLVQIDVVDGVFAQPKTWPYDPQGTEDFSRIIREEEGLPYWEDVSFEVDLMVQNPKEIIHQWVAAGVSRVVVHVESCKNPEEMFSLVSDFKQNFSLNESVLNIEIGVALSIGTDVNLYTKSIEKADFVQCMGIRTIGTQGNPFDPAVLEVIKAIKTLFPEKVVSVDGGVSLENAPSLIEAGAGRLVVGSAIFRSEDIPATIESFESL